MQHPAVGRVVLPSIAPEFSASPPSVRRLWPTLGEHTEEVLREVGLSESEIVAVTDS
jgi:crotonobetainyl-CoA:carnitine CoA-transferase CaiB-like acyl-CoA transferase